MRDVFDYLHIDTQEDRYTFCLEAFLENEAFRKAAAKYWGFKNGQYQVLRKAIKLKEKTGSGRLVIVPDLILYNDSLITVIESKMYAQEGWGQTLDYRASESEIISTVSEESKKKNIDCSVKYYFFTLAGINAKSDKFETLKWADFYMNTLKDVVFQDNYLETLKKAIYQRAQGYYEFEQNIRKKEYAALFDDEKSWITPASLFSNGLINELWGYGEVGDDKEYGIRNNTVTGRGHAAFSTDITINKRNIGVKESEIEDDNIWLFIRIEWKKDVVNIYYNWEYWKVKNTKWIGYIAFEKASSELKKRSKENRESCSKYLAKELEKVNKTLPRGLEKIETCSIKDNMLHMFKAHVSTDGTIGENIDRIKEYLRIFEQLGQGISDHLGKEGGYWRFS